MSDDIIEQKYNRTPTKGQHREQGPRTKALVATTLLRHVKASLGLCSRKPYHGIPFQSNTVDVRNESIEAGVALTLILSI